MRKELIYLWINNDKNDCFSQMGFNFSPLFHVAYVPSTRKLSIENTNNYNLFHQNNLTNITAVIGENGTGKTTLLQFLTFLSDAPLREVTQEYERKLLKENSYKQFIAVYYDKSVYENIKIINKIGMPIEYGGTIVTPYSATDFRAENYIGSISHIYLSNSEYGINNNLRGETVDYVSLTNNALESVFSDLFKRLFLIPNNGVIQETRFNALQSILFAKLNYQSSQMILDIMYQYYAQQTENGFCGKRIQNLSVSIKSILKLIPQESVSVHYQTVYSQKDYINEFYNKIQNEIGKILSYNWLSDVLTLNLLGELVFAYDFQLNGMALNVESVYNQCSAYINGIVQETEKQYYLHALSEIHDLNLLFEGHISNNLLPQHDLAYQEHAKVDTECLWRIIKNSIDCGSSFALKYLMVKNMEMSSGERALLNFMSRIYFSSKMNQMIPNAGFELNENVLLLVDEIDLYMHPEWQRRIISDLLNELSRHFQTHYFQIILTSHSPIVLSDIPSDNSIYLQRVNEQIIQINRTTQTFGANIHSLYRDAFFIKNGLAMGEYAKLFIDQLIKDITHEQISEEEASRKINLIGEPIIKKKLNLLLKRNSPSFTPMEENEHQNIINFLRQQKSDIERQIALLERR